MQAPTRHHNHAFVRGEVCICHILFDGQVPNHPCCNHVQEKHHVSFVQHTLPNGEVSVNFTNWGDIGHLFGKCVFLDETERLKLSVFSAFPNHVLKDVV